MFPTLLAFTYSYHFKLQVSKTLLASFFLNDAVKTVLYSEHVLGTMKCLLSVWQYPPQRTGSVKSYFICVSP